MSTRFIALALCALAFERNLGSQPAKLPQASDMKTIGLIGGLSWHSTAEYYRFINEAINDAYGNNTNPPLLVYNLNQQNIFELQSSGQWDKIGGLIAQAAARLRAGGAEAILLGSNTAHK